ncbi:MAG: hypothetical protein RJA59_1689 [Pseudomonadota bacterium]
MAAGNWTSGAGGGDAILAVGPRALYLALNSANKNREAIGHPVMQAMLMRDEGLGPLLGAIGQGVSFLDIGQAKMTAVAEGTEATATNYTATNVTITTARRAGARKISDFAASLQEGLLRGELAPNMLSHIIYDATMMWGSDLLNRIVAFATSASNVIGTTGTALTWSAVNEGILDLKNRGVVGGPALALISVKGAKDLAADGLSLGGAVGFSGQAQGFIANAQSGAYIGTFWGVDFFLNSEIDASGGDDFGLILTDGAVGSKHQPTPLPSNADAIFQTPAFTIEARRPGGGINTLECASYNGVAVLEEGRMAALRYVS